MKKFTVRAFVLALALTGAVATSVSSAHAKSNKTTAVSFTDPSTPAPMCRPSSGNTCGIQ